MVTTKNLVTYHRFLFFFFPTDKLNYTTKIKTNFQMHFQFAQIQNKKKEKKKALILAVSKCSPFVGVTCRHS